MHVHLSTSKTTLRRFLDNPRGSCQMKNHYWQSCIQTCTQVELKLHSNWEMNAHILLSRLSQACHTQSIASRLAQRGSFGSSVFASTAFSCFRWIACFDIKKRLLKLSREFCCAVTLRRPSNGFPLFWSDQLVGKKARLLNANLQTILPFVCRRCIQLHIYCICYLQDLFRLMAITQLRVMGCRWKSWAIFL